MAPPFTVVAGAELGRLAVLPNSTCAAKQTGIRNHCNQTAWLKTLKPCHSGGLSAYGRNPALQLKQANMIKDACRRSSYNLIVKASAELELVPPPIDDDLHELMGEEGAEFSADGIALSFGNDEEAIEAATTAVVVYDMSHFGRIRVSGDDRLRFLHNQSTANLQALTPGQGCDTVFVTNTARTIDLATAWLMESAVILTVSPSKRLPLAAMLDKYIFPADKVGVADITEKTCQLAIIGPKSDELMESLSLGELVGKPYGTNAHFSFQGSPVTVAVGSGLAEKGFQLLLAPEAAGPVWSALLDKGAVPLGSTPWEALRVWQGRPAPGAELTDEFNPLEAGLWNTISTAKGCYIGQETIARLITYNGVKQHLFGIQLQGPAPVGSLITADGSKVGRLTSYIEIKGQHVGLGYIKKQAGGVGLQVDVEGVAGEVVEVPFLTRTLPQP